MSMQMFRLFEVHAKLDRALREEQRRRVPDGMKVKRLKKLKLAVKDRLTRALPRPAQLA